MIFYLRSILCLASKVRQVRNLNLLVIDGATDYWHRPRYVVESASDTLLHYTSKATPNEIQVRNKQEKEIRPSMQSQSSSEP